MHTSGTAMQALLRRLSAKWTAAIGSSSAEAASADIPGLLRQLRIAPRNPALERYPTRVFMCAYMVLRHPEVVFSRLGDGERSLAAAAQHLVAAFEAVLHRVLEVQSLRPASAASTEPSEGGLASEASTGPEATFGLLLGAWDQAWGLYLQQFAAWKSTDAANLEVGQHRLVCFGWVLRLGLCWSHCLMSHAVKLVGACQPSVLWAALLPHGEQ